MNKGFNRDPRNTRRFFAVNPQVRNGLSVVKRELDLSEEETNRLIALLEQAPGPTPWDAKHYPQMIGPGNVELSWSNNGHLTTLVSDGQTYLALGFHCYVKASSLERMVEWHQLWEGNTTKELEVTLIDTRGLEKVSDDFLDKRAPVNPRSGKRSANGLVVERSPVATARIPSSLSVGAHQFDFPPAMESEVEILALVSSTNADLSAKIPKNRTPKVFYVVTPEAHKIEVAPLDWWYMADHDFGYEWISKLIRDPTNGNIVGAGVRTSPFVLDSKTYGLLGTWSPVRYKPFIYTGPDGKERTGLLSEIGKWMEEDSRRVDEPWKMNYSIRPVGAPPLSPSKLKEY